MKCPRCTHLKNKIRTIDTNGNYLYGRWQPVRNEINRVETKHGIVPCPTCNGKGFIKNPKGRK